MKTPNCSECKYLHKCKYLNKGEWIYFDVCTLFPQTDGSYEAYALVIEKRDNDGCEMFEKRGNDDIKDKGDCKICL